MTKRLSPPMTDKKHVIAVCGGLSTDYIGFVDQIPQPGESRRTSESQRATGGKGGNAAIATYRLSHIDPALPEEEREEAKRKTGQTMVHEMEVRMIGCVGEDSRGVELKKTLERHSVKVSEVQKRSVRLVDDKLKKIETGRTFIWVQRGTGVCSQLLVPGANYELSPEDFRDQTAFGDTRPDLVIAQLEFRAETVSALLRLAKKMGLPTLLNPAPADSFAEDDVFDGLTHLVMNEFEALAMYGMEFQDKDDADPGIWQTIANHFLERGVKYVVITLGEKGAFGSNATDRGRYIDAAEVLNRQNAAGAGDTFIGAYAVYWVRKECDSAIKWDLFDAIKYSCRAAALAIAGVGRQDTIPWADQVGPWKEPGKSPE